MASVTSYPERFNARSKKPCPEGMGKFVSNNIQPHWFGQEQIGNHPHPSSGNERDPKLSGFRQNEQQASER